MRRRKANREFCVRRPKGEPNNLPTLRRPEGACAASRLKVEASRRTRSQNRRRSATGLPRLGPAIGAVTRSLRIAGGVTLPFFFCERCMAWRPLVLESRCVREALMRVLIVTVAVVASYLPGFAQYHGMTIEQFRHISDSQQQLTCLGQVRPLPTGRLSVDSFSPVLLPSIVQPVAELAPVAAERRSRNNRQRFVDRASSREE
jgi:hypothetical protein